MVDEQQSQQPEGDGQVDSQTDGQTDLAFLPESQPLSVVLDNDVPGVLSVAWDVEPESTPEWTTNNAAVVAISSTGPDGKTMMPSFGKPGSAVIVATAHAADGSRLVAEYDFIVETDPATLRGKITYTPDQAGPRGAVVPPAPETPPTSTKRQAVRVPAQS